MTCKYLLPKPIWTLVATAAIGLGLLVPSAANALVAQRPFLGPFGPLAQPQFTPPGALAFDGANNDLLVMAASHNEEQKLVIEATENLGGTYKLSFAGESTGWEGEATLAGGESGSGDIEGGVEGTGKLGEGSNEVTGVATKTGTFAVGQAIEALGCSTCTKSVFPAGTTVIAVNQAEHKLVLSQAATANGLFTLRAGSLEVTNVSGSFTAGKAIAGQGIQLGTTITAVGAGTLTLSRVPTATATGVALNAGSLEATAMHTGSGALVAGERISGTGILPNTFVTEVNEGAGTFGLSKPPAVSGPSGALDADLTVDPSLLPEEKTLERTSLNEALERLPAIGTQNVSAGDEVHGRKRTADQLIQPIAFQNGLAERPLEPISCDGSGLTGSSPSCTVTEQVEGHRTGLYRYHEDGTPAPFSALGTNVIDGRKGFGGKPCAEESASCDQTPQEEIGFEESERQQIAVDESGTATDGDIYLADDVHHVVDVFAPDGTYLGQLTKFKEGVSEKVFGAESPKGVAVDSSGAVYVSDWGRARIHKYVPQANPVANADTVANFTSTQPCPLAVGAGPTAGWLFVGRCEGEVSKLDSTTGAVQYVVVPGAFPGSRGIAVNPADGHLFVVRQHEEGQPEEIVSEYDVSEPSGPTLLSRAFPSPVGHQVNGIAANPSSDDLYVSVGTNPPTTPNVQVFGPSLKPAAVTKPPSALGETTATLNGTVNPEGAELESCAFEWGLAGGAYEHTEPCAESPAEIGSGKEPVPVHLDLAGLVHGARYHYRLVAQNPFGASQGDEVIFVIPRPPTIEDESAQGVTRTEAIVKAKIDPEGFATTYKVEYGPTAAYGEETETRSLGPVDFSPHQVSFALTGLAPGTTYHWRFVADNTDPAALGTGTEAGEDRTFATFDAANPETGCPNQAFRTGPSAPLPDCRAYEMVSPLDKEGGDITPLNTFNSFPAVLDQSSLGGGRLAYGAYRAFGDAKSGAWTSQYVAKRTERGQPGEGWASHSISAPRTRMTVEAATGLDTELKLLSPDLCHAWSKSFADPPLAPGALPGLANLYRRTDGECGGPSYEALTTTTPPHGMGLLELQGVAGDESAAIYAVFDSLPTPAPSAPDQGSGCSVNGTGCQPELYYIETGGGQLRYVCVLPSGESIGIGSGCSAGSGASIGFSRFSSLRNAISADGDEVFWSPQAGPLYLRLNPGEPQSTVIAGDCTEAGKACTVPVSAEAEAEAGSSGAHFVTAAPDGSRAIFTTGGKLYEYDAGEGKDHLIAAASGVAGTSADARWVYLASKEVLVGEPNAQGRSPLAGAQNLYLYHEGSFSFVGALGSAGRTLAAEPLKNTTHVSSDGRHIAFETQGSPTGYDNTDLASGKADAELYVYDATADEGGGKLSCASCNPTGGRPAGANVGAGGVEFWAAAELPVWQNSLYQSRSLSEDGSRLFFTAQDALSPQDSNGVADVYEWEAAGGEGCPGPAARGFSAQDEGCVNLISSGQSPLASEFLDASPDGNDVFFSTLASLVPQDYGLRDVYDARVEGGFPAPPGPAPSCEGEACQSPREAPNDPTPASSTFEGAGNVHETATKRKKHRKRHKQRKHRHHAGHGKGRASR